MKNLKEIRSQVLTLANKLKSEGTRSFSECQKIAWSAIKAKIAMKNAITKITYVKTTGDVVTRLGTLCEIILPQRKASKKTTTTKKRSASTKINYYELNADGTACWKSFKSELLVSYEIHTNIKELVMQSIATTAVPVQSMGMSLQLVA